MNAQTQITSGTSAVQAIAVALTQGDYSLLPVGDYSLLPVGDYSLYDDDQWRATAQCCLDNHNDYPAHADNFDPLIELIEDCMSEPPFEIGTIDQRVPPMGAAA
jgi:L-ascorbate metabolism protein UlaG (beta-lactamase superfamily)